MRSYKNTIKLFFQSISVSIPYTLLIVVENVFLFRLVRVFIKADTSQAQPFYFINDLSLLCIVEFLFLLFITYEFMRKSREVNLDETLGKKIWIIEGNQLLVLGTLVLLYTLVFGIYVLVSYGILNMPTVCVVELVKVLVVNVFLLSVAAVGMGYLISRIKKRFIGYTIIIVELFLTLPNASQFLMTSQNEYNIPIFSIRDWVCLLPPDIMTLGDPLYGVPVEPYRIAVMCVWIILGIWLFSCVFWKYQKGLKVLVTLVALGGLVICGTHIQDKGSVLLMDNHPESAIEADYSYYTGEEEEIEADFQVTGYDMDLTFSREMSAIVKVSLQPKPLKTEYLFTLYHGYRVSKVEDANGEEMYFEQERDRVTVYNKNQVDCSTISFTYEGKNPTFYGNDTACFLPGFFPYYPKAGGRNVYLYEEGMEIKVSKEPITHFSVRTHGLSTTSNLKKVEEGFEGEASHATIVGGNYEIVSQNGISMVTYPLQADSIKKASQFWDKQFQDEWTQLTEFLNLQNMKLPLDKTIITTPTNFVNNSFLKDYYEFDDYILVNSFMHAYGMLGAQIPEGEKSLLKAIFLYMGLNEDTDVTSFSLNRDICEGDELDEWQTMEDMMIIKMRDMGVQPVARAVIKYLLDEEDTRKPMTFLNDLK